MNEEKSLFDLINTISSKTNQNPVIVKIFLTHLFKRIEKELLDTSNVTVPGLGTFKIIKSTRANRILFISDFAGDRKAVSTTATQNNEPTVTTDRRSLLDIVKSTGNNDDKSFEDVFKKYKTDLNTQVKTEIEHQIEEPNDEVVPDQESEEAIEESTSQTQLNFGEENEDLNKKKNHTDTAYRDLKSNITWNDRKDRVSEPISITSNDLPSDKDVTENIEIESLMDDNQESVDSKSEVNSDYDILEEYKDLETKEPRRSSTLKVVGLLIIFIFIIFALFYFMYPKQKHDPLASPIGYIQSYALLDNVDTTVYVAGIVAETYLDFASLSKDFYGCEIFWPYIYKANEALVSSPFEIKAGTIIYIPKVDKNIIDKNNKHYVDSANAIVKDIISQRVKDN